MKGTCCVYSQALLVGTFWEPVLMHLSHDLSLPWSVPLKMSLYSHISSWMLFSLSPFHTFDFLCQAWLIYCSLPILYLFSTSHQQVNFLPFFQQHKNTKSVTIPPRRLNNPLKMPIFSFVNGAKPITFYSPIHTLPVQLWVGDVQSKYKSLKIKLQEVWKLVNTRFLNLNTKFCEISGWEGLEIPAANLQGLGDAWFSIFQVWQGK